jgi:hypothetical protein
MGNRAIIAFEESHEHQIQPFGVYLHWSGGPESIWAFLEVLNERMVGRGDDIQYAAARFVEIIGRFIGGNTSIGLTGFDAQEQSAIHGRKSVEDISHGDNGVYVIGYTDKAYKIIGHWDDGKWLSDEDIANEREIAVNSSYWVKTPTIVEGIREQNAFAPEKADAH